jgi:hypothetical protein
MSKLLPEMRNAIRVRQYSLATERVYLQWVRRFILFHGKRHPPRNVQSGNRSLSDTLGG